MELEIFGYKIFKSDKEKKEDNAVSFTKPNIDDAVVVSEGGVQGTYIDLEGTVKNESELIVRYREMAIQPEVDGAIDDIINETVITNEKDQPVELNLDLVKSIGEATKKKITEEFDYILDLMDFKSRGHDIVRRWYVDGRLYYHKILDKGGVTGSDAKNLGVLELRYIDPRKIKKAVVQKSKKTDKNVTLYKHGEEFYVYNEKGFNNPGGQGIKITKDAIAYVNSGVYDYRTNAVLSHLHKAIKPFNQLRMLEDAVVIYRMARAPERRIFYIDVGNLPKMKAEQHLREIMTKHKNKLIYNPQTGEVKDDRKFTTMLEDYWLPRREGGKGTEITTLPGGQTLGEMEDVEYFRKKLYKSLNVPTSRIEDTNFTLGRATEISRDEVKFSKFIVRLRSRFTDLFNDILRTQLLLKNIITADEWDDIKTKFYYNWLRDNFFSELKDREIYNDRLNTLQVADQFVGRYFSKEWVMKKILNFDDEEIEEMEEQMESEEPEMNEPSQPGPDGQGDDQQQGGPDQEGPQPGQMPDQPIPPGPDKGGMETAPPNVAARQRKPEHDVEKKKKDKKLKKKNLHPGSAKTDVPQKKQRNEEINSLEHLLEDIVEKTDKLG